MRRVVMLVAIISALTGCGSSSTAQLPIVFGIAGGNIAPYGVSIRPDGTVHARERAVRQIPQARVGQLQHEIRQAHLRSRRCAGALPDVATKYIRLGRRTVSVHGTCEPGFERVWNDLARAVGRPTS